MSKISFTADAKLLSKYDTVVCGGGPAGCTAAAASAREGKRTLLIEATSALGGMGTMGLVPAWCPFSDQEKIVYRSLAQEVFEQLKERMNLPKDMLDWVPINAEQLKLIYDSLMEKYGVDVLFDTRICTAEKEGDTIRRIIAVGREGLIAVEADVFIDCTGDALLAYEAGAEIMDTGEKQSSTHCFTIANVDGEEYKRHTRIYGGEPDSPIHAILASGRYPEIADTHLCLDFIGENTLGFNAGHLWFDATSAEETSKAYIEGRKIADAFCRALKEFYPSAFGNCFVVQTAPLMGVRQSRRVVGDYVLTIDDFLARRTFEDEIARNSYYIDFHSQKNGNTADVEKYKGIHYGKGESHGIPYRSLAVKGIKNLLVAGRPISCDNYIQASVRVMPPCLCTGEAAGIAAALCEGDVHAVNTDALRAKLKGYGAYIL